MHLREQYRASVEKWRKAMPPCLEPFYDDYLRFGGMRDKTPLMQALESAYPDVGDRAVALLRWYGNGSEQWASDGHLLNERIVEDLLNAQSFETLMEIITNRDLAPDEMDGATRYIIGNKLVHNNLSDALRLKLLDYCVSTGDHAKIVRARNVLDLNLQQALASAETDTNLMPLTAALTQFSGRLFASIWKENSGVNLLISPYSIALALSLVYNGVRGTTADEIAQALGIAALELGDFNRLQLLLQEILEVLDTRVELKIAHGLWINKNISLALDFSERMKEFFHAEIHSIDFKEPSAVQVINEWVEQKTLGGISKILDYIDPAALMVLINTLYLKAEWTDEFEREFTKADTFTLLDGSKKQHPMMTGHTWGGYVKTKSFEAISLPYGKRSVSMNIFLPSHRSTLQEFQHNFTVENWNKWIRQLDEKSSYGSVTMPRFKFEYGMELNEFMKGIGINRIFNYEQADFSGMSDRLPYPYISHFQHKTFIEVDEEGTTAGAVTTVMYVGGSPTPTFEMVINRPFFFAIRDKKTGLILFMGSVVEPL